MLENSDKRDDVSFTWWDKRNIEKSSLNYRWVFCLHVLFSNRKQKHPVHIGNAFLFTLTFTVVPTHLGFLISNFRNVCFWKSFYWCVTCSPQNWQFHSKTCSGWEAFYWALTNLLQRRGEPGWPSCLTLDFSLLLSQSFVFLSLTWSVGTAKGGRPTTHWCTEQLCYFLLLP